MSLLCLYLTTETKYLTEDDCESLMFVSNYRTKYLTEDDCESLVFVSNYRN